MNTIVSVLLVVITSTLCASVVLCQGGGGASADVLRDIDVRLVGDDAPVGRFPYICSLRKRGSREHVCGATLVHPLWVLTAAHCVDPKRLDGAGLVPVVYCGIHDVNEDDSGLSFNGIRTVIHSSWSGEPQKGYDIAMIQLDRSAHLIAPALNALGNLPAPNELLAALGWGETSNDENPDKLQLTTRLNFITYKTCNSLWEGIIPSDIVLCAGIGERDTCRGDSGGPLLKIDAPGGRVKDGVAGFDLLMGVISFGSTSCGDGTRPGVYTDIGYFQEWILGVIEGRSSTSTGSTQPPQGDPCPTAPKLKVVVAAIEHDDATTVRAALECGLDPGSVYNNATSSLLLGDTLLQWAARFDSPHSAKVLLEFAAEIEERTFLNRTPLHYCAFYGSPSVGKVLLDHGADIEAQGLFGERPLDLAAWRGHPEVVKILVSNGADVNAVDSGGQTSLHTASQYGHLDIVKILLDAGASKTVEDNKGRKAVDVICSLNTAKCSNSTRSDIEALLAPSVRDLLTNPFLFSSG